jgi:ubiquitin C-terminal hydrolase
MIGYDSTNKDSDLHKYELFAAAIHSGGSIQGGHYYAIIRNANKKWYVFNDTNVIEFKGDETNLKMKLSEASCCFYRKK